MWHLVDQWTATRPTADDHLVPLLIEAIEPTLTGFGVSPAQRGQSGSSVVWCSPVDEVQISRQDIEGVRCTDLWVKVNQAAETITADFEGEDLLCHVRGTGDGFDHPEPFPLCAGLVESLDVVAQLLADFCSEMLVDSRTPGVEPST